jgi:ABC-type branched-subunit amino acid transport system permease subunit
MTDTARSTAITSAEATASAVRVTRSRRSAAWAVVLAVVVVAVMAYMPLVVYESTTSTLVNFFILLILASSWNLLAGYAGLVSVGQQAFFGLASYYVLILALHGVDPFLGTPIAALGCGATGLVVWWLVSRLRSGYFAIATWVIASVCYLIIIRYPSLGGGTGMLVPDMPNINATDLDAITYWVALGLTVVVLAGIYLMLRSRLGLVLTAVRDDETGARSIGGRVTRAQLIVFVVAAMGCGAAGGLQVLAQPYLQPAPQFAVQWSAEMIFAVLIGGIGTIEGPIIGTVVFFILQQELSSYGTWYFIILGLVAIIVAIWAPRGIWGFISDRLKLFPVGYHLWQDASTPMSLGAAFRWFGRAKSSG